MYLVSCNLQEDIVSFSRVWTGFDTRPFRGNLEAQLGERTDNYVDPMRIRADWRDPFPKMGLHGGYLGDGYPQCEALPPKSFLRKGARYIYLGGSPSPTAQDDDEAAITSWLTPDAASSSLYAALCRAAQT